jgi:site-specific recombinase XerD
MWSFMAQYNDVIAPNVRYTRADFTALRAYLSRIPISQISSLYYTEDHLEEINCTTGSQLSGRIEGLLENLILRTIDSNPHLAELLKNAKKTRTWAPKLVSFLVQSADVDMVTPRPNDSISAWFKPSISGIFVESGTKSLCELMKMIEVRGTGWWKPIPRVGAGKAASIENWLHKNRGSLGELIRVSSSHERDDLTLIEANSLTLAPIERVLLPSSLDGSSGLNRNISFCLISASNDYQAIDAYLTKFRHQEKTRRAYQKELERFLLWCITVRGVALSSSLQEDCESFKDFLAAIPSNWIGPKCVRADRRWRPFVGQISYSSQRYAVQAIRSFFSWLVDVRYLGGNPWSTVSDPPVAKAIQPLQIDRALPAALWRKLTEPSGILDHLCEIPDSILRKRYRLRGAMATFSLAAQFRLVRAALLLIGDTGLRREEAALATRDKVKPIADNATLWELDVLGKRNRWRTVFPSQRAISAISAHWQDRGQDFSFGLTATPLLSPLVAPSTKSSNFKHRKNSGEMADNGFSPDGLYQVIKTAFERIADDSTLDLTLDERNHLRRSTTHALRHTFGTQAVAGDVPLDVVQKVLGHASLQTTTIYVQAEKRRSIGELDKFFRHLASAP